MRVHTYTSVSWGALLPCTATCFAFEGLLVQALPKGLLSTVSHSAGLNLAARRTIQGKVRVLEVTRVMNIDARKQPRSQVLGAYRKELGAQATIPDPMYKTHKLCEVFIIHGVGLFASALTNKSSRILRGRKLGVQIQEEVEFATKSTSLPD